MLQSAHSPGFRGVFVTQLRDAILRLPGIQLDIELVAQERGSWDYLGANPRVRARWDAGRYDLAHVHYGLTGLATLMLPSSAPLVATFHGDDINSGWERAISVATLGRARRRIFVSRRLSEKWPSPRNVILPNGIDFTECGPMDRREACERLGLDLSSKWILFGGVPSNAVKGHDVFTEALEIVRRSVPEAQGLVLAEDRQPRERVIWKLNAASCLLFTSRRGREGSPMVVKEAIAVGLPVVSVDVGDVAERLEGVHPGGVVPWAETEGEAGRRELADALAQKTRDVLLDGRRSNGREVRGELMQEKIVERLIRVYREVAAESSGDAGVR